MAWHEITVYGGIAQARCLRHFLTPKKKRNMPNQLSTKLCRLFDGGYCTVKDFARLSSQSIRTIEWLTNRPGAVIDRETEYLITKTLAGFYRKFPELSWDIEPRSKRRIVETETHRTNERIFSLYDRTGQWRRTHIIPTEEVTDETLKELSDELDRLDPEPSLRVMRGGV